MSRYVIRLRESGNLLVVVDGEWSGSDDAEVELASLLVRCRRYTGYEPDEVGAGVEHVARVMRGDVIEAQRDEEDEIPPGVVY